MQILAIVGTASLASPPARLMRAAPAPAGTVTTWFDGMAALPAFNPDLDVEPHPAAVAALRARVAAADAIAICSTEYARSYPGSLKNLLDWLVSALEVLGKPALLVSVAPTRPTAAHDQLMEVLRTMMGHHLIDGGAHELASPDALAAFAAGYDALDRHLREAVS